MGEDHLSRLPPDKVKGWYKRLGAKYDAPAPGVASPMSGKLLLHWIGENGNSPGAMLRMKAPEHLTSDPSVISVLRFHRQVFLTETKGNFGAKKYMGITLPGQHVTRWAGIIPKIQSKVFTPGTKAAPVPVRMTYESLSDVAPTPVDLYRIQKAGSNAQRDIMTSLRGWQLKSEVSVKGYANERGLVSVDFISWTASGVDRYDWDYNEHFTVPNPDFRSTSAEAVRPQDPMLTVYHSNARRLEEARLAAPYDVLIDPWPVREPTLLAPAEVDPKKRLGN